MLLCPPAITARVGELAAPDAYMYVVKDPNDVALPVDAIVIKSILF